MSTIDRIREFVRNARSDMDSGRSITLSVGEVMALCDLYDAAQKVSRFVDDDVVVVPEERGVVEMDLTWGYLQEPIRAALDRLDAEGPDG